MVKYVLVALLMLHGLIHLMGFSKAFGYARITQITVAIGKPAGLLWLLCTLLFAVAATLLLLKNQLWWLPAIAAAIVSQVLIITVWKNAKWGTWANVIVLAATVAAWGQYKFYHQYLNDVHRHMRRTTALPAATVTEADLQHLPPPVQRYLRYAGVLNRPRVYSMKAIFEGEMRSRTQQWFAFNSQQYNFYDHYARLFFMRGRMKGMLVPGYHAYQEGAAGMNIKLFGLLSVAKHQGPQMFKTETVTLFNDMCLMAPATLIDRRIQWQAVDDTSAIAVFTNNGTSITAKLHFDAEGRLVNFTSTDRTDVNENRNYPFSTPVKDYRDYNGVRLASYGEGVWHYPDGAFAYGKFYLKEVVYNPR